MPPTRRLGRYELDAIVREEPLVRIWRARLPELGRGVWIAELAPPPALVPEARQRLAQAFSNYGRQLMEVGDPRVQQPCDLDRAADGALFLVFNRAETAGYEPLPAERRDLAAEEWVQIAADACEMLQALLDAGVLQETFRPANLYRSEAGELCHVPLQFDHLARTARVPMRPARISGAVTAPEQASGTQTSPASTVYQIAAWLHWQLTGQTPAEAQARSLSGAPPGPRPGCRDVIAPTVAEALERALKADPQERHPTPRAFAEALAAGGTESPSQVGGEPHPLNWTMTACWTLTGAIAIAALGLVCGWAAAQVTPLR